MGRLRDPIDEDAPEPMRELARRLRAAMDDGGYRTVRELGEAAELGHGTVADELSGSRAPSWRTVGKILQACGVRAETPWLRAQEQAKEAERRWRVSLRSQGAAEPDAPAPEAGPGMFSIRPPFGELPARVRGRETLLDTLRARLDAPSRDVQVLHGLGGCGKTTVALALAQHAREQGYAIFWLSGADRDRLLTGMSEIARGLGANEEEIGDAWAGRSSAMDLVWNHLDRSPRRWLLVVDNADEPGLLAAAGGAPGDGTGWVRSSAMGLTVVTSRVGAAETWGGEAECHLVGVLGPADGADVLIDLAGHAGVREEASRLAVRLGGLPLALRLAGSYLARTGRGAGLLRYRRDGADRVRSFTAYIDTLGDVGTRLLDDGVRGDVPAERGDDSRVERLHRQLISRTWELTLDLLDTQGLPEARSLMRLLSCFAAAPLPVALLDLEVLAAHGLLPDPPLLDRADRALEALVDLSLLEVTEAGEGEEVPCLTAHRIVLESNAQRLREPSAREHSAVWIAAVTMLESGCAPDPQSPLNGLRWRLLAPHVLAVARNVPGEHPDLVGKAMEAGLRAFFYLWSSRQAEAATELASVLYRRSEALAVDDPVRLSIRHRRALTHLEGEEELAEYASVLGAQREVLGPDHPETLITHYQWATGLSGQGRPAEAEAELRAVLDARRRVLGPSDPYTLLTLASLAELMKQRGHQEAADAYYQEVIEHSPAEFGFLDLEKRHQLAHALDKVGRFAEAERDYCSILAELEEGGAVDSYLYRDMKRCLSRNLARQGRLPEALQAMDACVELFARACAADDPALLAVRHERGDLLRQFDDNVRAEEEIRAVLEIRRNTVDDDDSVVLHERHCLAHALADLERYEEAAAELREVAGAHTRILGNEDPLTRDATYCLGRMLQHAGRWEEAAGAYTSVVAAETATLGAEAGETLMTRFRLAEVRHAGGTLTDEAALAAFEVLLAAQIEAVGVEHEYVETVREARDLLAAVVHGSVAEG
ncbi:tetratricopeptide repeat protein [Actinomadura oligospora]|uniref:tetratricopeptide repeat protein n=1 Tax=Actinomadura oligospora TaxID=111804 RepID=UPI00047AD73D|nr:tetratricopeptide repeat protein [Actinomadura oligospora]